MEEKKPVAAGNSQELASFLKREFKGKWKEILEEQTKKLKSDNIMFSDEEVRRIFAANIVGLLEVSPQKKEIYNSELKKILGIKTFTQKGDFKFEEKRELKLLDKPLSQIKEELITEVKREIDGGYYKVESIFNLFWLKAIEAELKGVKHERVMKIVKESLNVIRNDVNLVFLKFEDAAELNKEFFKLINKINKYVAINPPMSEKTEKKKKVANIIYDTRKNFNDGYENFVKYFLDTINEQIRFKKTGKSDFYLVNSDKESAQNAWNNIQNIYKKMSESFKKISDKPVNG
jgi:hypothetical protein